MSNKLCCIRACDSFSFFLKENAICNCNMVVCPLCQFCQ